MTNHWQRNVSLSEVHGSIDTTRKGPWWRQLFVFFGPAYLVSVGYMDPGNWATDLAGGSQFGYTLLWVLLMSNGMAILLQNLSARLGIVRGRDLAQANRETYPTFINIPLYILAEIAIAACDLAEVLGMAIGIQLLTGLPLIYGVCLTVLDTFLLLFLQRLGMRRMEAFIIGLIAIVGGSFLVEILLARPAISDIAGGFVPILHGRQALYIAIGIIGATVMPHNLYLHSALVQTRKIGPGKEQVRKALRINFLDSAVALNLAFLVNAAILILAATVFFKTGNISVASIKEAYRLLPMLNNNLAPKLFAIALIAAGQSSTLTGTLAGQIVMEGYLQLRINPWLRRLITRLLAIIPAVLVILIAGESEADNLLVLSQVILSVQLGFAVIPLIHFVSDRKKMGDFTASPVIRFLSWLVAALLVYLNVKLVVEELAPWLAQPGSWGIKTLILAAGAAAVGLLVYITLHPFFTRPAGKATPLLHPQPEIPLVHPQPDPLKDWTPPAFHHIAIALDFSAHDQKLLAYAVGQGGKDGRYLLIHIVESASARMLGKESDDLETRKDQERLDQYRLALEEKGYRSDTALSFRHRSREIARIVNQQKADMLVIGSHGHTGLKDFIYGETVNAVRHELKIPVLVVSL